MRFIDLTNRVYNRLTVLGLSGNKNKTNHLLWKCQCECGRIIECAGTSLNTGNTKSCGCYRSELLSSIKSIHRDIKSKEYKAWANMKSRCYDEKANSYNDYGGRGISVCDRWRCSYENFLQDMGRCPKDKHSIDRINNNGNYEPSNCRWATTLEQRLNQREYSNAIIFDFNDTRLTLNEFIEKTGITRGQFCRRYYVKKQTLKEIFNNFYSPNIKI